MIQFLKNDKILLIHKDFTIHKKFRIRVLKISRDDSIFELIA